MKKKQKQLIKLFKDIIEKNKDFILFTHNNPDGDAIGSILGFYYFLENLNKNVVTFLPNSIPYYYEFLIKKEINIIKELNRNYDVGIVLDCSDLRRVSENYDIRRVVNTLVNIDHHPTNTFFGDLNIVEIRASAVAEIVYEIIKEFSLKIPLNVAYCLMTGIITDTGSFKYSNTTHKTLKIANELVKNGVNISEISKEIYDKRKLSSLRLLGLALLRLQIYQSIAWSYIEKKDMEEYNANIEDTEGIIDLLRTLKDVNVVVLFYPINENKIKVSMRSKDVNIDVSGIALNFGGGGHKEAAGFQIEKNSSFSYLDILQKISDLIKKNEWVYSNK